MEAMFWAKAHGAATHFPLALVLISGALDGASFVLRGRPITQGLRAAGYWTMIGGSLGGVPAVLSGLLMTKGRILGHGALRMHHLCVWPAFALLVALATWRLVRGERATTPLMDAAYLLVVGVAGALVTAAGYWGGEMMMAR